MTKNTEKQKTIVDLLIIVLSVAIVYGLLGIAYMGLGLDLEALPLLAQTLIGALTEFGVMGLGITIVCIFRRESFASFGLKREKLALTLLLSAAVCLPSALFEVFQSGGVTYLPFQGVHYTRAVLASTFPVNIIGMLIIIASWGFFEGFTYVVLYDRINKLLPRKNIFFNWAAVLCALFCIALHLMLDHTYGIDVIGTFIIIYGMLVVYSYTGNAWGCVFVYCFYWNAV